MKKTLSLLLALVMVLTLCACSTTPATSAPKEEAPAAEAPAAEAPAAEAPAAEEKKSIALLFHNLDNAWNAQFTGELKAICEANNVELTLLSCDSNAGKQIQQVEDCTAKGTDIIIINAVDVAALDPYLETATEKGCMVYGWDNPHDCATVNYLLPLYDLGWSVGEAAAKWLTETYGTEEPIKVAQFTMSMYGWGVERGSGTFDALKELAPNVEVVTQVDTETLTDSIDATESFMTAHPDIKAIVCLGDTQALGANQALVSMGMTNYDEIGVFSADGTDEVVEHIMAGEFIKTTTGFLPPRLSAEEVWMLCDNMLKGEYDAEAYNYYRDLHPIDVSTGEKWLQGIVE